MMDLVVEHRREFHIFLMFEFFLQFHNQILNTIRIWHILKKKFFRFSGRLNFDVAIIEESRNDSFDIRGDILDLFQAEFAGLSGEKAFLFDIDDALIGHDPDIEIIIDPYDEKSDPDEDEKQIAHKSEKQLERFVIEAIKKN